jgi:hypothetical protein
MSSIKPSYLSNLENCFEHPTDQKKIDKMATIFHENLCTGYVIKDPDRYKKRYMENLSKTALPDSSFSTCYNAATYDIKGVTQPHIDSDERSLSFFYDEDGTPRKVTVKTSPWKVTDNFLPLLR